jgi:TetR/AcrR family transcriptional regulator, tetracycline repressor protein
MTDALPRRRRRRLLTREAILEGAARVLQRDGYGGLTMRAIADELQIQAPSLYWYVSNKEELEVMLYDYLMSGLNFELSGNDWREDLRRAAGQMRDYMHGRRDIALLLPRDYSIGPNALRQLEQGLAILLRAGLAPRDAAYAVNTLFNYIVHWASGEARQSHRAEVASTAGPTPLAESNSLAALGTDDYPSVVALADYLVANDADGTFDFGLDCIIAGLERRAAEFGASTAH